MATVALVVTTEERSQHEQQGSELLRQAEATLIADTGSFEAASAWLRGVVIPLKKSITDTFRPRISQAHQLHKDLVADEKRFLAPVERAEQTIKVRMASYEQEVERKRREAEEAVRKERERLEAEAAAAAEAERQRLQAEEDDRCLAAAAELEAKGDKAGAEKLVSAPIVIAASSPVPVFTPPATTLPAPRAEGVFFRDNWKAEVVDLKALVLAIASGKAPITLVKPDDVALGGLARSLKSAMQVPGVRVTNQRTVAARA